MQTLKNDSDEYPKIHTLFKRDNETHEIIEKDLSLDEFGMMKVWHVTEKVDGMNVRVFWDPIRERVTFKGHKSGSIIVKKLQEYLTKTFTPEIMKNKFGMDQAVLYGEGYGPGIQKGGVYRDDISFVLFDAKIAGFWLIYDKVKVLAEQLGIRVVPEIGLLNVLEIVDYVKSKPKSILAKEIYEDIGKDPETRQVMEGVVCRSVPLVLFRTTQTPVMFKLKVKDYEVKKKEPKKE